MEEVKKKQKGKAKEKIVEFNHLILNKSKYMLGDSVQILESADEACFGQILKIFRNPRITDAFVTIAWYYKPNDIFSEIPDFISEAELFSSNHIQDISVQSIYEKITVLGLNEYHELDEVDTNVYFVRGQYDYKKNTFEPDFSEWKTICYCHQILNPDKLFVKCDFCHELFHIECTSFDPGSLSDWYCDLCSC